MGWPAWHSGVKRQIGPAQMELLRRAVASPSGQLIIESKDNVRHCAIKRLTQRGLFDRLRFGNPIIGYTTLYEITEQGRAQYAEEMRIRS